MLFKKSLLTRLSVFCILSAGFFVSCGKNKTPTASMAYGPLTATNPFQPSLQVQNCSPGEYITCDLTYQYSGEFLTHVESQGVTCPANRILIFTFDLSNCALTTSHKWSGTATCTSINSKPFITYQPLTLRNVLCQ
jgi:hypothetical protein